MKSVSKAAAFGQFIGNLRKSRNIKVRDLSLASGVSHGYISQMERGLRNPPTPAVLEKLAGPLGISYEEMMKQAGYLHLFDETVQPSPEPRSPDIMEYLLSSTEIRYRGRRLTVKERNKILLMIAVMFDS